MCSHKNSQRISMSACEQSLTTQEIDDSVSDLCNCQIRSDQRLLRRDSGGGGYLDPITFNHGKLAKCKVSKIIMMRVGGKMSQGGLLTVLTLQGKMSINIGMWVKCPHTGWWSCILQDLNDFYKCDRIITHSENFIHCEGSHDAAMLLLLIKYQ